jgi:uncharacterized phage protein (TIGR02218 family)
MSRNVPPALLAHLQSGQTTTCYLLKLILKSGAVYGLTSLDQAVTYDDGADSDGAVTYVATHGFDPSMLATSADYSVDNAEANALISDETGITEEMIEAGEMVDAAWICYLVNYRDLSMGHVVKGFGDLGEVRIKHGLLWMPELLSIMVRLKKAVGFVDSVLCRANFGETPADSQTGCGVDLAPLWVNGEVDSVGAENNRTFIGDVMGYFPGRGEWLTGDNAGGEFAVESVDGLQVTLAETTPYPIASGDTYRIRPECRKRYLEDCITLYSNGPNFKGEPHILSEDAGALTPGEQYEPSFVPRPGAAEP